MLIRATPYRAPLARALAAELAKPDVLRDADLAATIVASLRTIGGPPERQAVERLILAPGIPAPVTVAAAHAIGHVGGVSNDPYWTRAIGHHAQQWHRQESDVAGTVLHDLVCALGMSRSDVPLASVRDDAAAPQPVRAAASWWNTCAADAADGGAAAVRDGASAGRARRRADREETVMSRPVLEPTAEHPITVEPTKGRVTVRIGGQLVADSRSALTLQESTYPAVQYIPLADVDPSVLSRTSTVTYCPYKGEANYYNVQTPGGDLATDVIWTYESPYSAVAEIAGHVAFYTDRAEVMVDEASA